MTEADYKIKPGRITTYPSLIDFDLINPTEEMINISDIALGLSYNSHYGGFVPGYFSISQHVLEMLNQYRFECKDQNISPDLKIEQACLLHDASEAYTGDMKKPLKILLPEFEKIEDKIQSVILKKFGVDPDLMKIVKPFDRGCKCKGSSYILQR